MGLKKTCVRYLVVRAKSAAGVKNALRCAEFKKASKVGKHPHCPGKNAGKRLSGGGRSKGLIRQGTCSRK